MLVFGQGYDAGKILFGFPSEDGRFLLVHVSHGAGGSRVDVFLQDLERDAPFETLVEGIDARFIANVVGDRLVVQTNWQAPNGRVMTADIAAPAIDTWRELIGEHQRAWCARSRRSAAGCSSITWKTSSRGSSRSTWKAMPWGRFPSRASAR